MQLNITYLQEIMQLNITYLQEIMHLNIAYLQSITTALSMLISSTYKSYGTFRTCGELKKIRIGRTEH